ncbi:band 7 protein [Pseudomonas phage vB_PpS_SYP]|nr:band 7 protein [Pseudomonas phage vB_PpS_SYP]
MRKFGMVVKAAALAMAATLMVGCGEKVEVPPGFVGKIMTKDGYQEGMIPTSKLRLPICMNYCDRMVVLDATDKSFIEPMKIFIPSDKLEVTLDVRATLSVDPMKAESLFNKLPQQAISDQYSVINADSIYKTYGQQVLQAEVRAYLTQYTISEIASNNEKINADIQVLLQKVMGERTPFQVRYAGLTNIQFPPTIVNAQIAAAERREQIQKEEAQLAVSKVQMERELQEARLNRQIEKEKAETEAIKIEAQAAAVTPQTIRMKELEVEQLKAEKWDGKLPQTVMGSSVPMIMDMRK